MRSEQQQQDETSDLKTKAEAQSLTQVSHVLLWEYSQFAVCHDELTQDETDPTPAAKTQEIESLNGKCLHPGGAVGGRRHRGHSLRGSPSKLLVSDRQGESHRSQNPHRFNLETSPRQILGGWRDS